MTESPDPEAKFDFGDRFRRLGQVVGERERAHAGQLEEARARAQALREVAAAAIDDFHRAIRASGAPHLEIGLSEIRTDDKHLRAVEFELSRGRHRGIVTAKSRGEVTFVGPFRAGKNEGPCRSFPFDAGSELHAALGDFLEQFLEAAAEP